MNAYTIGGTLRQTASLHPDLPVVVSDEDQLSYAELDVQADRLAAGLLRLGVAKGDHVAIWLPTCAEWIVALCAIARIGAIIVPVNTRYKADEVHFVLQHADVKVLITQPRMWSTDTLQVIRDLAPELDGHASGPLSLAAFPALRAIVLLDDAAAPGTVVWNSLVQDQPGAQVAKAEAEVAESDLLLICFTSGSTGRPKGVMHTHRVIRHCRKIAEVMHCEAGDRMLANWPLHHVAGLFIMIVPALATGAAIVPMPHWSASAALDLVERHRVNIVGGITTHFHDLAEDPSLPRRDLSSLKLCYMGGTTVSRATFDRIMTSLRLERLPSTYGMTENTVCTTFNLWDDPIDACAQNKAPVIADCEVRIVDPTTLEELPLGAEGEIWCRGATVMEGYYKQPEATRQVITEDGWLRTGDLGRFDERMFLQPTGRIKEILKVGGTNVSPAEVENYLQDHPAVKTAVVVGAPDDRLVEVGYAYVLLHPGARASEAEIIDYCRGKMADYKVPRYVTFAEEFPRLSTGKISRKLLADLAAEDVGRQLATRRSA